MSHAADAEGDEIVAGRVWMPPSVRMISWKSTVPSSAAGPVTADTVKAAEVLDGVQFTPDEETAAARGAKQAGGLTIGILPGTDAWDANPFIDAPIVTGLGEARNSIVARSGEVVVAVGGRCGTLSEIAYALLFERPVVGGDQQIGSRIAEGCIDFLIFFWDPLEPLPHDPDIKALLRVAAVWNIPVACNRTSADFMISSPLMAQEYRRMLPDYEAYRQRYKDKLDFSR
jgi:methylglyoxal synthase